MKLQKEKEKASIKKTESPSSKSSKAVVGDLLGDFMAEPVETKKAETKKTTDASPVGADGWGELEDFFSAAGESKGKPGSKPGKEKEKEKEKDSSKRSSKKEEKSDKKSSDGLDKASCEARIKKREDDRAKQRTAAVLAQLEAQCTSSQAADEVRRGKHAYTHSPPYMHTCTEICEITQPRI